MTTRETHMTVSGRQVTVSSAFDANVEVICAAYNDRNAPIPFDEEPILEAMKGQYGLSRAFVFARKFCVVHMGAPHTHLGEYLSAVTAAIAYRDWKMPTEVHAYDENGNTYVVGSYAPHH